MTTITKMPETMKKTTQRDIDQTDESSLNSEPSAAVVSLYNSWSAASDSESFVTQDDLSSHDMTPPSAEELLDELQKRCRPQDIPPTPIYRPRTRPVCLFINFMGQRGSAPPVSSTTTPVPLPSPVDSRSVLPLEDDGDDYLAIIESQSTALHGDDFDDCDDLFDCIIQVHKKPRLDDNISPLSPISLDDDDDYFPLDLEISLPL
jgi:hypothetical protein